MNRTLVKGLMTVAGLLAFSMPMLAHHGSRVSYDLSKQVTMKGVVTEYQYQNPHIYIMYDVKDENGNVVHWGAETNSPVVQARFGWDRRTLKPGDEITVTGNLSKNGSHILRLKKIVFPTGKEVTLQNGEDYASQ